MDEREGMAVQPKIQIKESYFIEDNGKQIPLDEVPVYYVTNREGFRIPVKIVKRLETYLKTWLVCPAHGEGTFEVSESQLEIDLAEYYA